MDKTEVAVSKFCCIACWDFFEVLSAKHKSESKSEGTMMYQIRGRHSTVYPVQLPSWIHPEVVRELSGRFDKYLHEQLLEMMRDHRGELQMKEIRGSSSRSGHAHKPSFQSVTSAITTATNLSGESNVNDSSAGLDNMMGQVFHTGSSSKRRVS